MLVIEYGHKYMDEPLNENDIKIKKQVENLINLFAKGKEVKYVALLDDIHIKEEVFNELEYRKYYELTGSSLKIVRESEMVKYANSKFKEIEIKCKKEYFRKEDKYVYFYITNEGKKIAVKEVINGLDRYYCVFLSYIWSILKIDKNNSSELLTIINKEFKTVEENVLILLKENKDGYIDNNYYIYI